MTGIWRRLHGAPRSCSWLGAALLAGAVAGGLPRAEAAFEPLGFQNEETQARYQKLVAELRCLVCQNQNLADSDADLARDLRKQVFDMLERGESDDAILRYMTDRYGDFVLYRPPLKAATLVLWGAPLLLGAGGLAALWLGLRRRAAESTVLTSLDTEERAQVARLLSGGNGDDAR